MRIKDPDLAIIFIIYRCVKLNLSGGGFECYCPGSTVIDALRRLGEEMIPKRKGMIICP